MTLDYNYYFAIYPVTKGQHQFLVGAKVADIHDATAWHCPMNNISYNSLRGSTADNIDWPDTGDEVATGSYVDLARKQAAIPSLDLPTESEWEFACRAGTKTDFNNGKNLSGTWDKSPDHIAWSSGEGWTEPTVVGLKPANNWNIYECHGHLNELCLDWYETTPYERGSEQTNPGGPRTSTANVRSCRGGTTNTSACGCRSASRVFASPGQEGNGGSMIGYRLKCSAAAY